MYIKHDRSYISHIDKVLLDAGYGHEGIHSVHFDRYFTEREKEENRQKAMSMSKDAWLDACDAFSKELEPVMKETAELYVRRFLVYPFKDPDGKLLSFKEYKWDLYYMGGNGRKYLDYFSLTFNHKRSVMQNTELLKEVISIANNVDAKNVYCRVQYNVVLDMDMVKEKATFLCRNFFRENTTVYRGMIGRIRIVEEDGLNTKYGFFKKHARTKYYPLEAKDVIGIYVGLY